MALLCLPAISNRGSVLPVGRQVSWGFGKEALKLTISDRQGQGLTVLQFQ